MKTCYAVVLIVLLTGAPALAQNLPNPDDVSTNKRAQTGMKFLTVSADPRAAAMAGAVTSWTNGSSQSLFYNPASMARLPHTVHAAVANAQYITDIDYNFATAAYKPSNGQYGVVGVSVMSVDYGRIIKTIRDASRDKGYRDIGYYSPTAMAVGIGYARAFTDRFSVGGQIKYVQQALGQHALRYNDDGNLVSKKYALSTLAYDFGVLYKTGFRSLTIGMSTRNFAQELTYVRQNFELPLTFRIGMSMDLVDLTSLNPDMHSFLLSVDARRPRDFSEQVRVGGEYTFMDLFSLRAGYVYPSDEKGLSLGAGLQVGISGFEVGFDYAYTQFGIFGTVNRLALEAAF